jgi:hypothetical protein
MALYKAFTTVNFVRLVVSVLFGLTLFSFHAFAQSELAESSPAELESGEGKTELRIPSLSETPKTRYNFTAAEYFYPIKPGADRSHFPEQLTLEPVTDLSLEELKTILSSQDWKIIFHCDGQAIPVSQFQKSSFVDGVANPSAINKYKFNGNTAIIRQTVLPPEADPNRSPIVVREGHFEIRDLGQGGYQFRHIIESKTLVYKLVRLSETEELLLELNIPVDNDRNKICPDFLTPKALLVSLTRDLTS